MALNYSQQPVFPAHISENSMWSPLWTVNGCLVEDTPEKYGECYSRTWLANQEEIEGWQFSRKDKIGRCFSPEPYAGDIVDFLPSDPFGMGIQTTLTAITGWLEDMEVDCVGPRTSQENYGLFAGWNLIWSNASKSQPFSNSQSSSSRPYVYEKTAETLDAISKGDEFQQACNEACVMGGCISELQFGEKVEGAAKSEEAPHDALKFCLLYLGVKDLLSVERVCSSLRSEVRGELLLWKSIHIERPLSEKITDDILLELACRADGDLQCLRLVECFKITDDCIKRILETNPRLTRLFIPGCTRLTIKGILNNIRTHNSNKDVTGIKQLRIVGLRGVTREHYEELKSLLGIHDHQLKSCYKPHFYHRGDFYLSHNDDMAIDIEMCPRCGKFTTIYDCPSEGCQVKDKASQICRGCTLCIKRCARCGRCIRDNEYEETFYLDLMCSDCFKQHLGSLYVEEIDDLLTDHT